MQVKDWLGARAHADAVIDRGAGNRANWAAVNMSWGAVNASWRATNGGATSWAAVNSANGGITSWAAVNSADGGVATNR